LTSRAQFEEAWTQLQRIDYVNVVGWLEGEIEVWATNVLPFDTVPQIFVGELQDRLDEVGDTRPIVTFCGAGYRASNAASILKRNGFTRVESFPGSMKACTKTECPIE